jgi:hypothetical protein
MRLFTITFLILLSFKGLIAQQAVVSYEDSLLLLEHKIWMLQDPEEKNKLCIQKALVYIRHDRYEEALQTYERIAQPSLSDSMRHVLHYQQMMCNSLSGHAFDAYELAREDSIWMMQTKSSRLVYATILIENKRWISAKQLLLSDTVGVSKTLIDSIRALPHEIAYKNPHRLKRLSAFFPGAGQWMAGYPEKSLLSTGLHLAVAGFIVYQALGGYYITAAVSGVLPLVKVYRGNKLLAEKLAIRKNSQSDEVMKRAYKNVLSTLSSLP